jgi:lipopolysaccharide/colanic/teichoic acid biosynthesis glycosyltransferase
MAQGTRTKEHPEKTGGNTVPVVGQLKRNRNSVTSNIDGELVNVVIADEKRLYDLSYLAERSAKNGEFLIRALDVAGSFFTLLPAMPAMLVVSLIIRTFSGSPVLYKQKRVGKNGKIFILYKFRTMVNGAEDDTGPVLAARDDWRVTRIGRILRQTRLDELPQLFNVLRGEMSLVGPRPERPFFVKRHKALQGVRLAVKPGLTGLAQIRSFYNLKPDHKLRYDYLYIQKRSFLLNLYILLRTVPVIFGKKGW